MRKSFVLYFSEIPNAISEDEILHIKERARFFTDGLTQSEARGGLTPEDSFKPSKSKLINVF